MEKKYLNELRKQKNFTQEDLAKKLNMSKGAIGMYETGQRLPSLKTAIKIAEIFDTSVENIIFSK